LNIRQADSSLFESSEEFKADTGARLTGILLDKGECFDFSLRKFADTVYRMSEFEEDEIVERAIHAFTIKPHISDCRRLRKISRNS